jgi:hypothetical protein
MLGLGFVHLAALITIETEMLQSTSEPKESECYPVLGTRTAADGGDVSPKRGRESKLTQSPMKSEANADLWYSVG